MRPRPVRRKRTRVGIGGLVAAAVLAGSTAGTQAGAVTVAKSDLDFILKQIEIAEAGGPDGQDLRNVVPHTDGRFLQPWGLRTVDGSLNNLRDVNPSRSRWGAADELFPRLLPKDYRDTEAAPPLPAPQTDLTNYAQGGDQTLVYDSHPRLVSNLIADQTENNPAAAAAADADGDNAADEPLAPGDFGDIFFIPNVPPDGAGVAQFNSWMTMFGQFFDHGLDLVPKGGNGDVIIPLRPDDPRYVPGSSTNFMTLTRATVDENGEALNLTTPFVDQQQTYGSHPSVHVLLREYALVGGRPVPTGRMLGGGQNGGLATWGDVKEQARTVLGIELQDADVLNVPMIAADVYGAFLPGPNGFPQLVEGTAENPQLAEGSLATPAPTGDALRSNHPFLADIAHNAVPAAEHVADPPLVQSPALDAHYVAGDGRINENIVLTAVHHVFHGEHNRMVDEVRTRIVRYAIEGDDLDFLNAWTRTPVGTLPANAAPGTVASLPWNGERIFQAARFATEMQYQHLAFEEFVRKIEPSTAEFTVYSDDIDPTIAAEFAHVVYRFGHSMLNETVDVIDAEGVERLVDGGPNFDQGSLVAAFLNPAAFANLGDTDDERAGAIARGMTRQEGNEIDEFTTEALRNNLVGLPLDLATLNLARARELGVPGLNEARRTLYELSDNDPNLAPHANWREFGQALRHPESLMNFLAAYGTHQTILDASDSAGKRAAALALIEADDPFLDSPAADSGLEDVDFWIGGLAEAPLDALVGGGKLSPTFSYVFRSTMENLQDGDRFYYLSRLEGMNLLPEVEANSLGEIVRRHTDARTVGFDAFASPDFVFDLDNLNTGLLSDSTAFLQNPNGGGPVTAYVGGTDPDDAANVADPAANIVMAGREGQQNNMRGGDGDDTLWAGPLGDRLEGGLGANSLIGGEGNDVLISSGALAEGDLLKGGNGHDAINAGPGIDEVLGGDGDDLVISGAGDKEMFLGGGNDLARGGAGNDGILAGDGDDWVEGGAGDDIIAGGHEAPLGDDRVTGDDVLIGGLGNDELNAEGGDDVMAYQSGVDAHLGGFGFDWVTHSRDPQPAFSDLNNTPFVPPVPGDPVDPFINTFDVVEGLSGATGNDTLKGDNRGDGSAQTDKLQGPSAGHELERPELIEGLPQLLTEAGLSAPFTGGNILLGGGGSDFIEGRGGDDLIDGDRQLDIELEFRGQRYQSIADFQADFFNFGAANRPTANEVQIIRVIRNTANPGDVDTAEFSGPRADYDIQVIGGAGNRVRVTHARGTRADGSNTLLNIEQLKFNNGGEGEPEVIAVGDMPTNSPATGAPEISDPTPARGQLLTASPGDMADIDGFGPGGITYQWQAERPQGWTTVATGATFTPGTAEVGQALRVIASFEDNQGNAEQRTSAATAPVADINVPQPDPAPTPQPQTQTQTQTQGSTPPPGSTAGASGARCTLPSASANSGNAGAVRMTAAQLLINQRISQAAVRRVNALDAKMDGKPAPSANANANAGAARVTLSTKQLLINQRISQAAVRRINALIARYEGRPAPRVNNNPPGRVTLSAKQLLINQRISQAAVRRVNALEQCVNAQG